MIVFIVYVRGEFWRKGSKRILGRDLEEVRELLLCRSMGVFVFLLFVNFYDVVNF